MALMGYYLPKDLLISLTCSASMSASFLLADSVVLKVSLDYHVGLLMLCSLDSKPKEDGSSLLWPPTLDKSLSGVPGSWSRLYWLSYFLLISSRRLFAITESYWLIGMSWRVILAGLTVSFGLPSRSPIFYLARRMGDSYGRLNIDLCPKVSTGMGLWGVAASDFWGIPPNVYFDADNILLTI